MAEHSHEYSITLLCQALEVSESGYYAWKTRQVSEHCREDARLSAEIQQIFLEHRQVYGSPRIHAALRTRGMHCSRKRVVRLMRASGFVGRTQANSQADEKETPSCSLCTQSSQSQ